MLWIDLAGLKILVGLGLTLVKQTHSYMQLPIQPRQQLPIQQQQQQPQQVSPTTSHSGLVAGPQ
ncbi:hypothetical protein Tco_0075814, partial [Tanacetum coccineum]